MSDSVSSKEFGRRSEDVYPDWFCRYIQDSTSLACGGSLRKSRIDKAAVVTSWTSLGRVC